MGNLELRQLSINGVFEISLSPHKDNRGFFMRTYDDQFFKGYNLHKEWVQENHSFSKHKGVIRGLHFQYAPYEETKLVRVASGKIFVVFVDIRKDSNTLGKWDSIILSEENKKMLYTQKGIAMGICTLKDNCTLLYKMDNYYSPDNQGTIKWNDSDINIKWPINDPILSERDTNGVTFREYLDKIKSFR